MKSNRLFLFAALAGVVALFSAIPTTALAQVTDTQTFTVRVPSNLTITAPAGVLIIHDETDNDQVFGVQQWNVKANARNGATVTFETNQAFTHTVDATYQADAQLDLAISSSDGPASWIVTNPSDQTNFGGGDGVATVGASSNRAGRAVFDLSVTFITGTFTELAEGDYVTTVTGTLTAN